MPMHPFAQLASPPPAARLPFVWTTLLEQDRGAISSHADLGLKLGLLAGPGPRQGSRVGAVRGADHQRGGIGVHACIE